MKITINDNRKVLDIKQEFNQLFPYLNLELGAVSYNKTVSSRANQVSKHSKNKTIGEFRILHNKGTVNITPNMTIEELKRSFNDGFGLAVEVLVKKEEVWQQATSHDGLTLGLQELKAELLLENIL